MGVSFVAVSRAGRFLGPSEPGPEQPAVYITWADQRHLDGRLPGYYALTGERREGPGFGYHGYHEWRSWLCAAVNDEAIQTYSEGEYDDPSPDQPAFAALIWSRDCEGAFGDRTCARLAAEFVAHRSLAAHRAAIARTGETDDEDEDDGVEAAGGTVDQETAEWRLDRYDELAALLAHAADDGWVYLV